MDWQAIGVIGALVGMMVASALGIRSDRATRKGQQQEREIAENTAKRSEAAAALTEEYTRRVVDALEKMATAGVTSTSLPTPRVQWKLEYDSGDTYRLTNIGQADARDVEVSSHQSLEILRRQGGPDLGPGEAMTFLAAVTMSTSDTTITVIWGARDPSGEPEGRWRYPLPGRPPRR